MSAVAPPPPPCSSAVTVRRRLDSDVAATLRSNVADLTNHSAADSSGSVEAIA